MVIIPTYNERENIERLIPVLLDLDPRLEVLIVDDSSPDGTAEVAREWGRRTGRVKVLERPAKMGMGSAYVEGMSKALEEGYDPIITMDADFSHDPKYIPQMLKAVEEADVAVGSRYVKGGGTKGWPLKRRLLSRAANLYARMVLGLPLKDVTGSFRCYRAHALRKLNLKSLSAKGFVFNVEIVYRLLKAGCKLVEVPIVFVERERGRSKMSLSIAWEGVKVVWRLRWRG